MSFTLRLPLQVYEQVASRKSRSITSFIVEAVEEKLARDRQEELARGFASLVGDQDEDVPTWLELQREAMQNALD